MAIKIKSAREIELMREAGRILGEVHEALAKEVVPGISTLEIDRKCQKMIEGYGCKPSFLGLYGYPASVCVSLNDEVVHGIPREDCIIMDGDIVSLDIGVEYKGYHSDAARTVLVGDVEEEIRLLVERTKESFFKGIEFALPGNHLHQIGNAIDDYCSQFGYGVVRDLCGHGVGSALHEEPEIPNFRKRTRGPKLKEGMTLAVEPMINEGTEMVEWVDDGWTVVTLDGSMSAHYENTILITEGKPEILTLTPSERGAL